MKSVVFCCLKYVAWARWGGGEEDANALFCYSLVVKNCFTLHGFQQ